MNDIDIRPGDISSHGDAIHHIANEYDKPVKAAIGAAESTQADLLSPLARPLMQGALGRTPATVTRAVETTRDGVYRYGIAAKAVSQGLSAQDQDNAERIVLESELHQLPFPMDTGQFGPSKNAGQLGAPSYVPGDLTAEPDYGYVPWSSFKSDKPDDNVHSPSVLDPLVDWWSRFSKDSPYRESENWLRGAGSLEIAFSKLPKGPDGDVATFMLDAEVVIKSIQGLKDDPINTLLTMGFGWILEHVQPYTSMLDKVAGDGAAMRAVAKTWGNIGDAVATLGTQVETRLRQDISGQQSRAVAAYFTSFGDGRKAMAGLAEVCDQMSKVMTDAAGIDDTVRFVVRCTYAQLIADVIQYLLRMKGLGFSTKTAGGAMSEQAIVSWVRGRTSSYWSIAQSFIKRMAVLMRKLSGKLDKLDESAKSVLDLWRKAAPDLA